MKAETFSQTSARFSNLEVGNRELSFLFTQQPTEKQPLLSTNYTYDFPTSASSTEQDPGFLRL